MDLQTYYILGVNNINCDNLVIILHRAYLHGFQLEMDQTEYQYLREYQERIFDFVEDLRELKTDEIENVLNEVY